MKKTLIALALIASCFTAQAQTHNLMDTPINKLSYQQKKEAYANMTDKQIEAVDMFWGTQEVRAKLHNVYIDELSFNEIIEKIQQENNKKEVVKK